MEDTMNAMNTMYIDPQTLEENFSKNEIQIIKQLQDITQGGGGSPPRMTLEGRNKLMEKLHNLNNKTPLSNNSKDTKNMTSQELEIHRNQLKERLRNKINSKQNSRSSKFNQSNRQTTDKPNIDITNNPPPPPPDLTDINNLKNIVGQMTNSQSNPEIKKRFNDLFGTEDLNHMLKDDKMKELMNENGFTELFNNFANQLQPPTQNSDLIPISNKKKSKKKSKKKKPTVIIENYTEDDIKNTNGNCNKKEKEEEEELLDDYVEKDEL